MAPPQTPRKTPHTPQKTPQTPQSTKKSPAKGELTPAQRKARDHALPLQIFDQTEQINNLVTDMVVNLVEDGDHLGGSSVVYSLYTTLLRISDVCDFDPSVLQAPGEGTKESKQSKGDDSDDDFIVNDDKKDNTSGKSKKEGTSKDTSRDKSKDKGQAAPNNDEVDEEGEEGDGLSSETAKVILKKEGEVALKKLTLVPNAEYDLASWTGAQTEFVKRLGSLRTQARANLRKEWLRLHPHACNKIANYFFSQVLGTAGLAKFNSIIESYTGQFVVGSLMAPGYVGQAALRKAKEQGRIASEKRFLKVSGTFFQKQIRNDAFADLDRTVAALDFYDEYLALERLIEEDDPEMAQRLKALEIKKGRGKNNKSRLHKYICHTDVLGISPQDLNNELSLIEPVHTVTEKTRRGLLVIMPGNPLRNLRRFVGPFMDSIMDTLLELAPEIVPLAQRLDNAVLYNLINGHKDDLPGVVSVARSANQPGTVQRLMDACGPASADPMEVDEE